MVAEAKVDSTGSSYVYGKSAPMTINPTLAATAAVEVLQMTADALPKGPHLRGSAQRPQTKEIKQPSGEERQAMFRTTRMTKICKLGKRLENAAVRNFLDAMRQEKVIKASWQYQIQVTKGLRTNMAQIHRHMAAFKDTADTDPMTTLPSKYGTQYNYLAQFADGSQENMFTAKEGSIGTIYSPYNASFYEQVAYQLGGTPIGSLISASVGGAVIPTVTSFDLVADVSGVTKTVANNVLKLGYGLDTEIMPHDTTISPFFGPYNETMEATGNEAIIGNTQTLFQRHTSGGVKINLMNGSEYPMNVDVVVFKCKTNASGDDAQLAKPDGSGNGLDAFAMSDPNYVNNLALSDRIGGTYSDYEIADMYNPVVNILANNSQKFENWKWYQKVTSQNDGAAAMEGRDEAVANFQFTTPRNVHASPTWKFLGNYATGNRVQGARTTPGSLVGAQFGADPNYTEVNRIRVSIPVSGSYIHDVHFGGMQYDILDRVNRSRNQRTAYMTTPGIYNPTYKITDIRGETYCIMISACGQQQFGVDTTNNKFGMITPDGKLAVRVEEYEIIQPFYADTPRTKPMWTNGNIRPNMDLDPKALVPMTQWVSVKP